MIPLSFLEVWGRFGYLLGLVLMVGAFGGFTFRPAGHWGLGRTRQSWDAKALYSMILTFVLIVMTGYVGSFFILVPGAQTFESLKDLTVFLCIVLFGYPALVIVPFAYGLSDLIEGVPPAFLLNWLVGYFINPSCFWVAHQFIGKNPDFRKARTWGWYALFVLVFMLIEPQLWGYICSEKFTSPISYRSITPALFFTTTITWLLAPFAMLGALPLARKFGMFWAEIDGHARERQLGDKRWIWESRRAGQQAGTGDMPRGIPIRMMLATPFIVLVLVMVGATAYLTLSSAQDDADKLASRLHQEIADNINLRLDDDLESTRQGRDLGNVVDIDAMLKKLPIASNGRAFIIDRAGTLVASSAANATRGATPSTPLSPPTTATTGDDPIVQNALLALRQVPGGLRFREPAVQFHFDVVTARPLARETWLTQATAYQDRQGGHSDWILMTAMPQAYYLEGVHVGSTRSAMILALALTLSLGIAALLAAIVTAPIARISRATRSLALGDLAQRVPDSRLEELSVLSSSFNQMSSELRERTERLQLATSAASLGVWDWDVVDNELVWDEQMHRLFGRDESGFSGTYDDWADSLLPQDRARAQADVEAALRGEREFDTEFSIRWPDGSIHVVKGVAHVLRDGHGHPLRMVGVNYDVSALLEAHIGWRGACFAWAGLHLLVGLPLNWSLPTAKRFKDAAPNPVPTAEPADRQRTATARASLLLGIVFAVTWFTSTAMAAHLPRLLMARGATLATAVFVGALVGPAQVAARVLEFGVLRQVHPLPSARLATLMQPLGAALIGVFGASATALFGVLHGAGNGILTIAKGTLPLAIFGPAGYGQRQGLLMVPARIAQALAPWLSASASTEGAPARCGFPEVLAL